MKTILASLSFIFLFQLGFSQQWETVAYLPGNYEVKQLKVVSENNFYVSAKYLKFIHWDGTQWNTIGDFNPLYEPFFQYNSENDIYATHNDYLSGDGQTYYNYIAHWDGSTWSNTGDLNVGKTISKFKVAATNEIYAVGNFTLPGYNWKPVAKYNGNAWEVVGQAQGNAGAYNTYGNLFVKNANDIYTTSGYSDNGVIVIKHWDGNSWEGLYDPAESINRLSDTYAVSENEVYSFGYKAVNGHSCIAFWNGSTWTAVGDIRADLDLSNAGYNSRIPYKYVRQNQIYAVGSAIQGAAGLKFGVAKWNGTQWEEVGNLDADNEAETMDIHNGYLYIAGELSEIAPSGGRATVVKRYFIDTFFIAASSNTDTGGSVSGTGVFSGGEIVTLIATPANGYHFVNWTENGTVVSDQELYQFEVEVDRELIANFQLNSYEITTTANPIAGGSTTGTGLYNFGETAIVTATPAINYTFENWKENGQVVSTEATYEFVVEAERELEANFQIELAVPTYNVEGVVVFPNPFTNSISVKTENSSIQGLAIFDLLGRLVLSVPGTNSENMDIETLSLAKGNYILKIATDSGSVPVRIIKK